MKKDRDIDLDSLVMECVHDAARLRLIRDFRHRFMNMAEKDESQFNAFEDARDKEGYVFGFFGNSSWSSAAELCL